jgi:uncharacterized membrane protein
MSIGENETLEERAFDYARTVSLSDGVFAIALTLLVLNIGLPELAAGHRGQLGHRLLDQQQQFEAYGLSFAVIALLWVRHHTLFRSLARVDGTVAAINLVYLGFVAFLPYPTRVLAAYTPEPTAIAFYAANGAIVSGLAAVIRFHSDRAKLLTSYGRREMARREHWAFAPLVFLGSIPLAFIVPRAAAYSWVLLLVVPGLRMRRRDPS